VREGKGGTGTYNARPVTTNLMIHGNVGTGSSFEDSSPAKHTVTTVNSATHSGTSKFGGTAIYGGNGYASGNRIEAAGSDVGTFGTGDFTVDFWMKSDGSQTTRSDVVALYDPGWTENFTFDFNDGSYGIWFFWNSSGGNKIRGLADGFCTDGDWHHVAAVRYGTTVNLFVDGTSVGTATESGTMGGAGTDDWLISNWGSGLYGWVDEMRICTGTALWTSAFTPPTRRNLSAPVVDRSGNDNGGNFNTTDMTDVVTYRVGEVIRPIDSAVWDFDGSDDYVNLGSGSSLKPTTAITISVWVNPDSSQNTYADIGGGHQNNQGYVIQQDGANANQYYFAYRSTAASWKTSSVTTLTADTWQHFVIVCEFGVTIKHYLNGVETVSDSRSGAVYYDAAEDMFIGHGFSTARCFNGQIANVQIYKVALTPQQVKENFNQQRNRFKI